MRSNGFSDAEGEWILNNIKFFTQLKILDLSGNLEFGEKTFIALQRITILPNNKMNFKERQNKDFLQMFKHMSFLDNNQFFNQKSQDLDSKNDSQIKDDHFNQIELENNDHKTDKKPNDNDPQLIQDENSKLIQPNPDEDKQYDRHTSFSSTKSTVDISLQLLCLQYKPEKCEEAYIHTIAIYRIG